MKHFGEVILGVISMLLAIVCVWEYTIIRNLQEDVKSKSLLIDAQAVRARDLQEQIVEKDKTVKLLTTTPQTATPQVTAPQPVAPQATAPQTTTQPAASQAIAPQSVVIK